MQSNPKFLRGFYFEWHTTDKNIFELAGVMANPTYEKALEGIALYKKENIDFILAIGGGSVVDCCKVICAGAKVDEDIWNMEIVENRFPSDMASFGVVLTLSGAGAQMDCLVMKKSVKRRLLLAHMLHLYV